MQEVLDLVGLADKARRRVGTFSLGMRQRLGIAAALIGDPGIIVLDEPMNGLDPDGIIWVRSLLRRLADEGRTVLVSSHLMGEMAQTADQLVVVGRGRLVADVPTDRAAASDQASDGPRPRSRTRRVSHECSRTQARRSNPPATRLSTCPSLDPAQIARLALEHQLEVHELVTERRSLEDAFLELTHDATDYRAHHTTERTVTS